MSGQLEWSALTARGNSRTWRKNCTAKGPRAGGGSRPSAMRSQSGWRPKARPASIIARRSSTNAPPSGIRAGLLHGRERRQLLGPERAHVHRDRALARDAGDRLEDALVGHPLPRAADARRVRVLLGERAPLHAEVALRDDVAPIAADREHAAVLDVDLDAAERV